MGGPKWSGMSDKSTCQHTHMVSFPALPSPNSPRSGKAVCHGSLVLALPRLPMSLTGHQPCGMAPLSPGPIPISSLALIANHAGFPPSKGQAFSISKTCACSWHRPRSSQGGAVSPLRPQAIVASSEKLCPTSGPQAPLLFSPLSLSILEHHICVSVYFCSFSP